jgi:polysaccharide biosynthesis protein PslG
VARATLRLSTKGAGQYSLRPVAPTWSEASTSYANAPAPGATTATFRGTNGWASVDVTSLVQGNGAVSLAVTSASGRLSVASRETRDAAQLTVELASPPPPLQTPAPAASDRFGMSAGGGIHNEPAAELARDLDSYSALGVRWVRVSVNWAVIQDAGPTSFNWAPFDAVVDGARARGAKVLALIEYTPRWARPAGSPAETPPTRVEDYAAFAGKVAERYAPRGVHAFEVWNEPNVAAFWRPKPDVAAYTRLLRAASTSIRAADPQALVLTGGTSPATDDGTDVAPVTFLRGVYANGGKDAFDAVAHHPYCWPVDPGDPQSWSAWHQMYGTSPSLRSVMTANGDGDKKIWATEFGAPTNGPSGSSVSEADQSRMLAKGYALFGTYAWAGPLFWYSHRDLGTSASTRENFFGLLRNDFSPKPSYSAYRTAAAGA